MIAEILNIECNEWATQHTSNYQPLDQASNPMLEHSYPHLQIDNKVIHHSTQHHLRDAATQEEYFKYLQEKFEWENQQIQDIHWPLLNRAMQQLNKPTRRIISKIIHEWLPLETRYHICSQSTQQYCLSCRTQAETADHFLRCTHPIHQQLWDKLIDQIQQLSIKKHHHMIQDQLIQGIRSITTDNMQPPTDVTPHSTHCSQQQQIGWKQIIYR